MGERDKAPVAGRRTFLVGVAGVMIGAGMVRVGATGGSEAARATGAPQIGGGGGEIATAALLEPVTASASPPSAGPVRHGLSTTPPPWARRWHAPIYDLDDFLARVPHAHFPHRSVLLTVDDGPSPEWTPRYLRLFAKHDVKATFNMIGRQVAPNHALVRAVASEGHTLANHAWDHDERLPYGSVRHIRREIARTNEAIHAATGLTPTQFRAPGGVWGPRVYAELARQRMMPLGWDVDPRDWARPGVAHIESTMLRAHRGDIVLCHDGGGDRSETYRALKVVIPALKQRGLHFVTLP